MYKHINLTLRFSITCSVKFSHFFQIKFRLQHHFRGFQFFISYTKRVLEIGTNFRCLFKNHITYMVHMSETGDLTYGESKI